MKSQRFEPKKFMRQIEEGAARLNPALEAIAIVLLILVIGELMSYLMEALVAQPVRLVGDSSSLARTEIFYTY